MGHSAGDNFCQLVKSEAGVSLKTWAGVCWKCIRQKQNRCSHLHSLLASLEAACEAL